MRKFVNRLAVAIASAIVSMAFVTVATPGVSSADCDNGQWWDPVGGLQSMACNLVECTQGRNSPVETSLL